MLNYILLGFLLISANSISFSTEILAHERECFGEQLYNPQAYHIKLIPKTVRFSYLLQIFSIGETGRANDLHTYNYSNLLDQSPVSLGKYKSVEGHALSDSKHYVCVTNWQNSPLSIQILFRKGFETSSYETLANATQLQALNSQLDSLEILLGGLETAVNNIKRSQQEIQRINRSFHLADLGSRLIIVGVLLLVLHYSLRYLFKQNLEALQLI